MHEIDSLSDSTDRIDLDFVSEDGHPNRSLKSIFGCIYLVYHF